MDCWQILELAPTDNQRNIKRAYAKKLKVTHPEDDPVGFQVLQEAFETAVYLARHVDFEEYSALESEINESEQAELENIDPEQADPQSKKTTHEQQPATPITFAENGDSEVRLQIVEHTNKDNQSEKEDEYSEEDDDEEPYKEHEPLLEQEYLLLQGFMNLFQEILDNPNKRKKEASWNVIFEHEVLDIIYHKQQISHSVFNSLADFLLSHQPESQGAYIPKKVLEQLSDTFDWQSDELALTQYYDSEDLERILVAIHGSYMAQNPDSVKPKWQFYVKRFLAFLMWFIVINMIMRVFTYILEEKQNNSSTAVDTVIQSEIPVVKLTGSEDIAQ